MTSLFQFQGKPRTGRITLRIAIALSVLFPVMACAQVAITTTALPAGNTSNLYTATLAATGGTAPYTWQLAAGSLPAGLSLSSAGVISGKATTVTTGTPPVPASFTVQVTDSTALTATQTYGITVLAPGSHSLVINQYFTGGNGSTSSPYAYNYAELFNASPSGIDLQNWTIQIAAATLAFSQTGVYPLGSLDPYTAGDDRWIGWHRRLPCVPDHILRCIYREQLQSRSDVCAAKSGISGASLLVESWPVHAGVAGDDFVHWSTHDASADHSGPGPVRWLYQRNGKQQ